MVHKKDKYGLYDSVSEKSRAEIKYEMVKLPLQDYVATARKASCNLWGKVKVEWGKFKSSVTSSVSSVRRKTQGKLQSVGVNNPYLLMEVGAIGSASVVGFLLARKKPMFYRILYPTLAGGSLWTVFHFSSAENRATLLNGVRKMQAGYQKSVSDNKNTTSSNTPTTEDSKDSDQTSR